MNHPEIPKDHPRFKLCFVDEFGSGDLCYLSHATTPHGEDTWIPIDEIKRIYSRQDCAAHAAAWWFEKATDSSIQFAEQLRRISMAQTWLAWGSEK